MQRTFSISLGQLAQRFDAQLLKGDPDYHISSIASLNSATSKSLSFFANSRYLDALRVTRAGAVLVDSQHVDSCPVACLVVEQPYLLYARISQLFQLERKPAVGVHSSSVVDETATIDPSARIGPLCSIGRETVIGAGCVLESGVHIADRVQVMENSRMGSNVSIGSGCRLGRRTVLHHGVVVGSDGFGFAVDAQGNWQKIAQLGAVQIDDDVEIGANSAIDAGALDDTRLQQGVKLDNMVHVAHNVIIGEYTVIAAGTMIGGSTEIGAGCMIGGKCGIASGLKLTGGLVIGPATMVFRNIDVPGTYYGAVGAMKKSDWTKNYHLYSRLHKLFKRLKNLEKKIS